MHFRKINNIMDRIAYSLVIMFATPVLFIIALFYMLILLGFIFDFDAKSVINLHLFDYLWIIISIYSLFIALLNVLFFVFYTYWKLKAVYFFVKKLGTETSVTLIDISSYPVTFSDENGSECNCTYYYFVYEYCNAKNERNQYMKYASMDKKPRKKRGSTAKAYFYKGICRIDD